MSLLKYAVLPLLNNKKFVLLFLLNYSLGLAGFVALNFFKDSMTEVFNDRSKAILGADLGLSSRRPIKPEEIQQVKKLLGSDVSSDMVEVFTMLANSSGRSLLTQIKAVDSQFPFYGEIRLDRKSGENVLGQTLELKAKNLIWLYPEIARRLKINWGDKVKLGEAEFTFVATVADDSAQGITTSMAPRAYIHMERLPGTKVIQFGSVAWYSQLFQAQSLALSEINTIKDELKSNVKSTDLRIYTHIDTSEQMARFMKYLNDFLGLSSLSALFLALIGIGFLYRTYLISQYSTIGIMLNLGLSQMKVNLIYLIQLSLLGGVSAVLSLLLGILGLPVLQYMTRDLLSFELSFSPQALTFLAPFLLGLIGVLLLGLPFVFVLNRVKPKLLILSFKSEQLRWSFKSYLALLPALGFIWGLAVLQARSFVTGSLFTGLLILSALALALVGWVFITLLPKILRPSSLGLRWALRDIAGYKLSSLVIFVSIGLGMTFLNLIPQIKASLNHEMSFPKGSKLPSFFMFDIQEDQIESLKKLSSEQSVHLDQISPMVRARLMTVNGINFSEFQIKGDPNTREAERQRQSRNRGYNLSYRSSLAQGEEVVEGPPFSGTFKEGSAALPEISIETRFAERLGVKIGDKLVFDIQGVEISGVVINLRKVRWTTFRPNFFILFQPGVLDLAPKTFLATAPGIDENKKIQFQDRVVETLPNVSFIDVGRLVKKLVSIVDQMSLALFCMTLICLVAGLFILFSIVNFQAQTKSWEVALYKSLGTKYKTIFALFMWPFLLLSVSASLVGIGISFLLSFALSHYLFETSVVFDGIYPTLSFIVQFVMTLVVVWWAIRRHLAVKANTLL